ncbi:MAG: hypothetical protein LBG64_02770 [Pseudomonadales bacterium]|jgi:hypothetical protein|nr:hypothetical protein [Pseudomonadales bacterium]
MADSKSREEIEKAYRAGMDTVAMLGLFTYFLYKTPEGKQVRQEINEDWMKCVITLQEKKKIKGRAYTLREFCGFVKKGLEGSAESDASANAKKRFRSKKKQQKFKGV